MSSLFPFPAVRPGQDRLLADARESFAKGLHLVAHAPTGLGKTAAALTAALDVALPEGLLVVVATSRQSQHAIIIETLQAMHRRRRLRVIDLISKQDMCPREMDVERYGVFQALCSAMVRERSCEFHRGWDAAILPRVFDAPLPAAALKELCRRETQCPHRVAMEGASEADVIVCDYNLLFSPAAGRVWERIDRPHGDMLLIVDEAHNLPDRVRLAASPSLSLKRVRDGVREADRRLKVPLGQLEALVEQLTTHEDEREIDARGLTGVLGRALELRFTDLPSFIDEITKAGNQRLKRGRSSALTDIARFLGDWDAITEGDLRTASGGEEAWDRRLRLRLLDPAVITAPVFTQVRAALLMSGTLQPEEFYRDLLGLEPARTRLARYPSPFPPENRLAAVVDDLSTLYNRRGEALYRRIAGTLAAMARATPGNAAAFFPSYGLLREVQQRLDSVEPPLEGKRLLIERRGMSADERRALLRSLENRDALLLAVMGSTLSEGVDYPDNLLQSIAVVGLPLPPPSLENRALEAYFERKFGNGRGRAFSRTYPAINRVRQAMGRGIRSETDRGVALLLDFRLAKPPYRRFLPRELRSIRSEAVAATVEGFFADSTLR